MEKNSALPSVEQMQTVLSCIPHLYLWTYDKTHRLLQSSCPAPHRELFHRLFLQCGYMEQIDHYTREYAAPYALSIYMGLVWYAVFEKNGSETENIYLLGPIFQYPVSIEQMDRTLRDYEKAGMSFHSRRRLLDAMKELPVIAHTQFASYAIMLHYCVTGQKISYEDLQSLQDSPTQFRQTADDPSEPLEEFYIGSIAEFDKKDMQMDPLVYKTIRQTEEDMAQQLRSGRPFGQNPQSRHMALLPTDASGIRSSLGKARLSAALMTYHYAQTAITCGLNYEAAYRIADEYLGEIDKLHSPMGLQRLMGEIHGTFDERLKRLRVEENAYSYHVQLCLDHIRNHLTEPVSLETLAKLCGYSPYYLSRRFRQETGMSIKEAIRTQKIRYAAHLLVTTEDSISDIVETIGLSSRSHFCTEFSRIMGMGPGTYRKKRRQGNTPIS